MLCYNKAPRYSGYDARLACRRSRVQTPSGPLETFASQLLDALYRVKLKGEKRPGKSSNSGNRAQMNFSVTYFFINDPNEDFGSKKILDENFCSLHKASS